MRETQSRSLTSPPLSSQVVGDDILVTNPERVAKAIEAKCCNALLLKVNQIGSVSEAIEAVRMAKAAGWGVMTSHRWGAPRGTLPRTGRRPPLVASRARPARPVPRPAPASSPRARSPH